MKTIEQILTKNIQQFERVESDIVYAKEQIAAYHAQIQEKEKYLAKQRDLNYSFKQVLEYLKEKENEKADT